MNILLDTHALLWFVSSPEKLSEPAYSALMNKDNQLWISVVSVWEIQIKHQLGKLQLDEPIEQLIETQQKTNDMNVLGVELAHIYVLNQLENHHRDPFDRLLIAQAQSENYSLMTRDNNIHLYRDSVNLLW
jgi:PIN domain nuclease of toxin-antitoxin system